MGRRECFSSASVDGRKRGRVLVKDAQEKSERDDEC